MHGRKEVFTVGVGLSDRSKAHGTSVHEGPTGEYLVGRVPIAGHNWLVHVGTSFIFGGVEPKAMAKITLELRSVFGEGIGNNLVGRGDGIAVIPP